MATVTIDEKTLAALQLAAKFILDHADRIDYHNNFSMEILRMTSPSATIEAITETRKDSTQQGDDLEAVLAALQAAGIDD